MIVIALVAAFVHTKHDQLKFLQYFSTILTHLGSVGSCNRNTPIFFCLKLFCLKLLKIKSLKFQECFWQTQNFKLYTLNF
jgi:hypothetical protein